MLVDFSEEKAAFLFAEIAFLEAKARHFYSYKGSIALVEIDQDKHIPVICKLNIRIKQILSDLREAFDIEIHGEKRQIRSDVCVSETFIKFDAINDLNSI